LSVVEKSILHRSHRIVAERNGLWLNTMRWLRILAARHCRTSGLVFRAGRCRTAFPPATFLESWRGIDRSRNGSVVVMIPRELLARVCAPSRDLPRGNWSDRCKLSSSKGVRDSLPTLRCRNLTGPW
jgi:hypothetical protein